MATVNITLTDRIRMVTAQDTPTADFLRVWNQLVAAIGGTTPIDLTALQAQVNANTSDINGLTVALAALTALLAQRVDELEQQIYMQVPVQEVTRAMVDELEMKIEGRV
ncbi:hypothetical protein AB4120_14855 [Cupriavidus sp. 2KB_3]|uniref:hypothetical protein n=1 Tax=Cupriavidus sp. 2KB_3 TaxID=3232980 RepID=UPI003F92B39E